MPPSVARVWDPFHGVPWRVHAARAPSLSYGSIASLRNSVSFSHPTPFFLFVDSVSLSVCIFALSTESHVTNPLKPLLSSYSFSETASFTFSDLASPSNTFAQPFLDGLTSQFTAIALNSSLDIGAPYIPFQDAILVFPSHGSRSFLIRFKVCPLNNSFLVSSQIVPLRASLKPFASADPAYFSQSTVKLAPSANTASCSSHVGIQADASLVKAFIDRAYALSGLDLSPFVSTHNWVRCGQHTQEQHFSSFLWPASLILVDISSTVPSQSCTCDTLSSYDSFDVANDAVAQLFDPSVVSSLLSASPGKRPLSDDMSLSPLFPANIPPTRKLRTYHQTPSYQLPKLEHTSPFARKDRTLLGSSKNFFPLHPSDSAMSQHPIKNSHTSAPQPQSSSPSASPDPSSFSDLPSLTQVPSAILSKTFSWWGRICDPWTSRAKSVKEHAPPSVSRWTQVLSSIQDESDDDYFEDLDLDDPPQVSPSLQLLSPVPALSIFSQTRRSSSNPDLLDARDNFAFGFIADQLVHNASLFSHPSLAPFSASDSVVPADIFSISNSFIASLSQSTDPSSFFVSEPPSAHSLFLARYRNSLVYLDINAWSHWKKLATFPLAGEKPVVAFVLHESASSSSSLMRWLDAVRSSYETSRYGQHFSLGPSSLIQLPQGALSPSSTDPNALSDFASTISSSFREALYLLKDLSTTPRKLPHVVFYVLCPCLCPLAKRTSNFTATLRRLTACTPYSQFSKSDLLAYIGSSASYLPPASSLSPTICLIPPFDSASCTPPSLDRLALSIYNRIRLPFPPLLDPVPNSFALPPPHGYPTSDTSAKSSIGPDSKGNQKPAASSQDASPRNSESKNPESLHNLKSTVQTHIQNASRTSSSSSDLKTKVSESHSKPNIQVIKTYTSPAVTVSNTHFVKQAASLSKEVRPLSYHAQKRFSIMHAAYTVTSSAVVVSIIDQSLESWDTLTVPFSRIHCDPDDIVPTAVLPILRSIAERNDLCFACLICRAGPGPFPPKELDAWSRIITKDLSDSSPLTKALYHLSIAHLDQNPSFWPSEVAAGEIHVATHNTPTCIEPGLISTHMALFTCMRHEALSAVAFNVLYSNFLYSSTDLPSDETDILHRVTQSFYDIIRITELRWGLKSLIPWHCLAPQLVTRYIH